MTPRGSKQDQTSGEGGIAYQAGRDIVVQSDIEEMRQVALDVYRENALELRGIAEDIAYARASRITDDFFDKLHDQRPESTESLADPDVQSVLFSAQTHYARSGEEDLAQVLVDLLADRAAERDRSLRTLALNEAIDATPKLTEQQRRAVGLIFILRYARYLGAGNVIELFNNFIRPSILSLAESLPEKSIEYQHMEYVGVGSISMSHASFIDMIKLSYPGLFTKGFSESEIPETWPRDGLGEYGITRAIRNSSNFQVSSVDDDSVPDLVMKLEKHNIENDLKRLMKIGLMSDDEVLEELVSLEPKLAEVARVWNASPAKAFTLTSVGIAIGHAYWQRVTGKDAPLSVWL